MSRRGIAAGLVLVAAATVLAAALLWIARTTLRLEAAQAEAMRLAAQEEKVRLSLWRMDSALTSLVGRENALPPEPFRSEAGRLAGHRFEVDLGSPDLPVVSANNWEVVGDLPIGPLAAALAGASALPASPAAADAAAAVEDQRRAERPRPPVPPGPAEAPPPADPAPVETAQIAPEPAEPLPSPQPQGKLSAFPQGQMAMNVNEFNQRLEAAVQQNTFLNTAEIGPEPPPEPSPQGAPSPAEAPREAAVQPGAPQASVSPAGTVRQARRSQPASRVETTFQPVWLGGDLYLVRRVVRDGKLRMQGIRVDWPGLRAGLLGEIADLLPDADLLPIAGEQAADPGRRLALLPARLVAGALPAPAGPAWTPARLTVAAASGAIVLAAVAVTLLLLGSIRQGRRRADFVSAVTHELRTPLTTLRMYADMLSGGMVPPGELGQYHETLSGEAERLGHLVENVLAYSRLERRRGGQPEAADLADLLAEMAGRLGAAAARGGFELVIHPPGPLGDTAGARVLVDRGAVERILLNWIDNACKYAGGAEDRRLEIQPLARRGSVVLRLSDHGPGIPKAERRRIFRPFHKSARRAAASAPGVGLGLTLSRRLARSLGGDLRLVDAEGEGAAFELVLRAAPPGLPAAS